MGEAVMSSYSKQVSDLKHVDSVGMFCGTEHKEWSDALLDIPHDVYHTPAYGEVCTFNQSNQTSCCYVWRKGDFVGLIPLIFSQLPQEVEQTVGCGFDGVSPYGYGGPIVWDKAANKPVSSEVMQQFMNDFKNDGKNIGLIDAFLRGHPVLSSAYHVVKSQDGVGSNGSNEINTDTNSGNTYAIKIDRPVSEILGSYRSSHKRSIKKLEKEPGLRLVWDEWNDLTYFVPIYHDNMTRLEARSYYFFDLGYFVALKEKLKDMVHLLSVYNGDVYIGGVCFFVTNGIIQYHLPACVDSWRNAGLPKVLIHELVKWGARNGDHLVHLGGGVGGQEDSLAYFKNGFTEYHLPFRTYKVVLDATKYSKACQDLSGGKDLQSSSFFPAYRAS
jgi:hypothetical protein